jgi:hypothetical protein
MVHGRITAAQILLEVQSEAAAMAAIPAFAATATVATIAPATTPAVRLAVGSPPSIAALGTLAAVAASAAGSTHAATAVSLDATPIFINFNSHRASLPTIGCIRGPASIATTRSRHAVRRFVVVICTAIRVDPVWGSLWRRWPIKTGKTVSAFETYSYDVKHRLLLLFAVDRGRF